MANLVNLNIKPLLLGFILGLGIACAHIGTWKQPTSEQEAVTRYNSCMTAYTSCNDDLTKALSEIDALNAYLKTCQ